MDELILLTDGSVNYQSNIGYGAYLAVPERGLSLDSLRARVKVRRFEHTSSTKLELQTLLWALSDIQALGRKVIVYRMIDQLDCELVKVCGHQVSNQKDDIDRLFALVDGASRKALREDNRGPVVFNKPMEITRNNPGQKHR